MRHSREQASRGMPPPLDDELVSLSRLAGESGLSALKLRKAFKELGDRVLIYPKEVNGRLNHKTKLYPLRYTLDLLGGLNQRDLPAEVVSDRRVSFQEIVAEVGWAPNTIRKYMASAERFLISFPGEGGDRRKTLYPLQHTLKLIRREHSRAQARRERSKDEAAGYWTTLAKLKVARG